MADPAAPPRARPLSPHLQVYRLPLLAILSISHRVTGAGLVAGTLLLVWWLIAAASGPQAFALVQAVIGSWIGQIALIAWTLALFYHLANGIRHLFWDAGFGFELKAADQSGYLTMGAALALTVLTWLFAALV